METVIVNLVARALERSDKTSGADRKTSERERSGERKSEKLVERGAAI